MRLSLLILASLVWGGCAHAPAPPTVEASTRRETAPLVDVAAPGRVEGASEVIAVGAGIDGVVRAIAVAEGQAVQKGQRLAEIDCPELPAQLREAEAQLEAARQTKARLLRGSREEQRRAAEQRTAAAKAVLDQAESHHRRIEGLHRDQVVARLEFERAKRDHDVALAQWHQAVRDEQYVKAPPLGEEVAKADAEIAAATQRAAVVGDRMSRCVVRAPITGTILRVKTHPGESFSMLSPKPLFEMADVSMRRVRAEVDEKDVDRIRVDQRVWVSTDTNRRAHVSGRVTSIAGIMGRRKVLTGDPAEKADRDVLEVLVDLDGSGISLPVGLRVVLQFEP